MQPSIKKTLEIVVCILALVCSVLSINHCAKKLAYIETLAKSSATPQLYTDFSFYVDAAQRYKKTGELYDRPADGETFASRYYPMAPVFKFPPAFQLQVLPIAEYWTPETLKSLRLAMIIGYFLSCLALMANISLAIRKERASHTKKILFLTLASIIATSNPAFWDCILNVNYEIPIFCLLVVSFLLLSKHPRLSAAIIGYLAVTKIYPAFMASILLVTPKKKPAIAIFITSILLFSFATLFIFGSQEIIFYTKNILPVISREKVAPMLFSLSFGSELFRLTQNIDFARAAFQILRLTLLAISFFMLFKYHKTQQELNFFALLMTLMLICLPNYWVSYLIMLFPAFCVAIRRVIIHPDATGIIALFFCACLLLIESQSWMHFHTPAWLTDISRLDTIGSEIISAMGEGNGSLAALVFLRHYPVTAALYLLEQIKFILPITLWFFVVKEISSTAQQYINATGTYPTSSNPER